MGEERSGCRTVLMIGCGVILAIGALGLTVLALNYSKIKAGYEMAATSFAGMEDVRKALQARYAAAEVSTTMKRQTGTEGWTLAITLVDPTFPGGLDTASLEERGKDIAVTARGALKDPAAYAHYDIQLVRHADDADRSTITTGIEVDAKDLPPPSALPPANPA